MEAATPSGSGGHRRRVGFAGLGAMGSGMASNLLKAGFSVTGFDVNPAALQTFAGQGGQPATTARAAAEGQDRFFIMVASPDQADSVLFGSEGATASLAQGAIVCLFSTLPPQYVEALPGRLEKEAARGDLRLLDCPVSGGFVGAAAGKLSVMFGGDEILIKEIQPELDVMANPERVFYCGPLGAGATIKMTNQLLAGSHIVVAAEALAFAKTMGLSTAEAHKILMSSVGASWIMGDRGATMLTGNWKPQSAVTIFIKDLGIVNSSADSVNYPCPVASVALSSFIERAARGHGRDDDASVVCNYEEITGKSVVEANREPTVISDLESLASDNMLSVTLIVADQEQENFLKPLAAKQSERLDAPELLVVSSSDEEKVHKTLESMGKNSVVGISGLASLQERFGTLSIKYPHLHFTDVHMIPTADESIRQVLYSTHVLHSQKEHIQSLITAVLPAQAVGVPVTGAFGSAASMYLTVRMASLMHITAAAEVCRLASAKGVSSELVYNLINGAAGGSAMFAQYYPIMLKGDFNRKPAHSFESLKAAIDDLNVLKTTTARIGFPARLLDAVHQIFKAANRRFSQEDVTMASVISFYDSA